MPSYRAERTSEDVLRELNAILRELKDPRVHEGMLTIIKIDLARDLSFCKVYLSSLKGIEEATAISKVLNKGAAGFIRHSLSERLDLRHTPEIKFIPDASMERSAHIAEILNT
ncbi:MAG: 30S ribosome-binding factor RbfA, partial [Oscillospiraceae bacterium]